MTIQAKNHRQYLKLKARMRDGLPGIPQLPDDILRADNCLTDEQERTAAAVIEASTWALLEARKNHRHQAREDKRAAVELHEYTTSLRNGCLIARSA